MKVLITTSGTGSRLYNLTKFTNKSLVKLGNKLSICYIIEHYGIEYEFIITIGYFGNLVKEFLQLAYPKYNFTFIEIDNYDKEGSSLGYSMLKAKDYLQTPFIFHCCDTIILDIHINNFNINTLFINKKNTTTMYSTVEVDNTYIRNIYNKDEYNTDNIYIGIVFIKDYEEFWNSLEYLYKKDIFDSKLNDVSAFKIMLHNNISFSYRYIDTYFDTGNLTSYNIATNYFKSSFDILEKNNESLCFFDNNVIKFVSSESINKKRIIRGTILYPLTPKILNSTSHFISMEFIKGTILSECTSYGEIKKLLEWSEVNLWKSRSENNEYITKCKEFYYDKTVARIKQIKCLESEKHIVNTINVGSIEYLISQINFDSLYTSTFFSFHGDFILNNIIKTENEYKLIDWRDEFGGELYYGDKYYDLAKLKHNIIFNHKNITNELYSLISTNEEVSIDLKCNYFLIKQLDDYNIFIKENNYDLNKIDILVSLIWINMSPLYSGKLSEFLFYFGKLNLYLALKTTTI